MSSSTDFDDWPEGMLPAYPPEDYKGSQASWMIGLQERGLWDGEGWHGDILIPEADWWSLLEECEEGYDSDDEPDPTHAELEQS